MPRPPLRRVLAPLAVLAAGLAAAACSVGVPGAARSAVPSTTSDIAAIQVTGGADGTPKVSVPTPFSVASSTRRLLVRGTGPLVKAGQRVTVDYLGINGTDGHQILSSYGGKSPSFVLDPKQAMPGIVTSLVGVPVGSRVLAALAPKDAYGVQGQPAAGIGPTDTIVVLLDVKAAGTVLQHAAGTPVAPRAGLPTVKVNASGRPSITLPKGAPPDDLVVQPLLRGRGAKVVSGQQLRVQYLGVIWPGGREFDSSWRRDQAATITVGRAQVVSGLDRGLVGQTVGSRVLLVVPPDDGYGAAGNASFGVRGTDTLVFVVDILDAS
jgi:FKBP-type peptidyl-prolyl cis-trans isomerase